MVADALSEVLTVDTLAIAMILRNRFSCRPSPDWLLPLALILTVSGCRRGEAPDSTVPGGERAVEAADLLEFPADLRTDNAGVNEFVERAMRVCAAGNYDDFRLLWSAREEPLPRRDYEQGWHAVTRVRIRAVEKVLLVSAEEAKQNKAEPEAVFAVCAEVLLDPQRMEGRSEPKRTAVVLIVREADGWRLTRAPKEIRSWLLRKLGETEEENGVPSSEQPAERP